MRREIPDQVWQAVDETCPVQRIAVLAGRCDPMIAEWAIAELVADAVRVAIAALPEPEPRGLARVVRDPFSLLVEAVAAVQRIWLMARAGTNRDRALVQQRATRNEQQQAQRRHTRWT